MDNDFHCEKAMKVDSLMNIISSTSEHQGLKDIN